MFGRSFQRRRKKAIARCAPLEPEPSAAEGHAAACRAAARPEGLAGREPHTQTLRALGAHAEQVGGAAEGARHGARGAADAEEHAEGGHAAVGGDLGSLRGYDESESPMGPKGSKRKEGLQRESSSNLEVDSDGHASSFRIQIGT